MRVRGFPSGTPCWAELIGGDHDAATRFYGDLFGWRPDGRTFRLRDLAAAGLSHTDDTPEVDRSTWVTYLATEDIEATAALVADAGGTVLRAPHEMPSGGLAALFADPDGAVFGAFQKQSGFGGAQVNEEPGASCWVELSTPHHDTAAAFYGKIFDWTEQRGEFADGEPYGEWVSSACRVVAGLRDTDGPARWLTCFEADDCDAVAARAVALGGAVAEAPRPVEIGTYAVLTDPTGAAFGIISFRPELHA